MLSPLALVPVSFHGQAIDCVRTPDGKVLVSIRRLCENLGLSYPTQWRKLQGLDWACVAMMTTHDESGRNQEMAMLPLDSVPMWLATIHATKVRAELRPALVRYQTECRDALAQHFGLGGGGQVSVDALVARLDQRFAPVAAIDGMGARLKALEAKISSIELDGFINEDQKKEVDALIQRVAKDHNVDFRKVHGWLKIELKVSTFRYLLISRLDDALGYLRSLLKSEPQEESAPNLDELVDLGECARSMKLSTYHFRTLALDRGVVIHDEYGPGRTKSFVRRRDLHKLQAFVAHNPRALN